MTATHPSTDPSTTTAATDGSTGASATASADGSDGASATAPDDGSDGASATAPDDAPDGRSRARTRFVFIDTEATGLDHTRHELTEVAWIVRFEDGREVERRYFPEHTTDGADADALVLTHYDERIAPQDKTPARVWLTEFLEHADGAVLVGAVPDFDARHLELTCRKLGLRPTWDHHLLDVETLALPLIADAPEAPRSLAKTCAALGVPHDKDQAHGALYDAQQAKRVFDRVWELLGKLRAEGAPLPPPVPRESRRRGKDGHTPAASSDDPSTDTSDTPSSTTAVPDRAANGPNGAAPDGV